MDMLPKVDSEPITEAWTHGLVRQTMENFVQPEVRRRREAGQISGPFGLKAVQVLLYVTRPYEVRLNDEVRVIARVEALGPIKRGDPVLRSQIGRIEELVLTPEDADAAHITILWYPEDTLLGFDFRYNASLMRQHATVAKQYLDAARLTFDAGLWVPTVDLLYSATELLAKALLLSVPDENYMTSTSHQFFRGEFNRLSKQGPVRQQDASLLNRLGALRDRSRYLKGDVELDKALVSALRDEVEDMYGHIEGRVPLRISGRLDEVESAPAAAEG